MGHSEQVKILSVMLSGAIVIWSLKLNVRIHLEENKVRFIHIPCMKIHVRWIKHLNVKKNCKNIRKIRRLFVLFSCEEGRPPY